MLMSFTLKAEQMTMADGYLVVGLALPSHYMLLSLIIPELWIALLQHSNWESR